MRAFKWSLVIASLATPALAVDDYDACLDLIAQDPQAAEQAAGKWARFEGGGAPARHCYALALIEIGAPGRAIYELLGIAAEEPELSDAARAEILVQAGEMLVEEGDTLTSAVVAEQALGLAPRDPEVLGLRAAVKLETGDLRAAIRDLDEALSQGATIPRLLLRRASAHRRLGDLIAARDDASFAVEAAPSLAIGWLELGRIQVALGDTWNARQSLLDAIALDRDGEIGKRAQLALQRMEAGID